MFHMQCRRTATVAGHPRNLYFLPIIHIWSSKLNSLVCIEFSFGFFVGSFRAVGQGATLSGHPATGQPFKQTLKNSAAWSALYGHCEVAADYATTG